MPKHTKCKHEYHRLRQDSRDEWYVYCDKCLKSFEPAEGISRKEFDEAFDLFFKGELNLETKVRLKSKHRP